MCHLLSVFGVTISATNLAQDIFGLNSHMLWNVVWMRLDHVKKRWTGHYNMIWLIESNYIDYRIKMKSITEMSGLAEVILIKRVPLTFPWFLGPKKGPSLSAEKNPSDRPSPGTENRQMLEERHCRSTSGSLAQRFPRNSSMEQSSSVQKIICHSICY